MPFLCIFGCKNPGATLHVFPYPVKYPERFKAWASIVGAKLETLTEIEVYKKKRICDIHFLPEHKSRNNRLSILAVPLLHLPDDSSSIAVTTLALPENVCENKPTETLDYEWREPKENQSTEIKEEREEATDELFHLTPLEADPLALDNVKDDEHDEDDIPAPAQFEEIQMDSLENFDEVQMDNLKNYNEVQMVNLKNSDEVQKNRQDEVITLPDGICALPLPPGMEVTELEDLYLPDILDPDLLKDTNEKDKPPAFTYGESLDVKLCTLWRPVLASGLSKEARNAILTGYPTPNNTLLIEPPQMNIEIADMVPEKFTANDGKWYKMQKCIATALTAINRAMDTLLAGNSRATALRHLCNSCLILCDLHCAYTRIRVNNVTPFLDDTAKRLIKDSQRDLTVFGQSFSRRWKAAKKLEPRIVRPKREKKRGTCSGRSLVLYSGRWHRARPAGRGRRPAASATGDPATTPRRRRAMPTKPRRAGNAAPNKPGGGVKRKNDETNLSPVNRNIKKLKQVELYDAFGNKITTPPPFSESSFPHMHVEVDDTTVQEEVVDQSNQSSNTDNPNSTIMIKGRGNNTRVYRPKRRITKSNRRIKQTVQYDAFGDIITPIPPGIETSHPHMRIEENDTAVQEEVVDQSNQSCINDNPNNIVIRAARSNSTRVYRPKKHSTTKLKQTVQYNAFGEIITTVPTDTETSHPHMRIGVDGQYEQEVNKLNESSITHSQNNTITVTTGAIPLVLQLPSRDMSILYPDRIESAPIHKDQPSVLPPQMPSRDMPIIQEFNDEPTDQIETTTVHNADVHHGIVDNVIEVATESDASLLLPFKYS